MKPTPRKTTKLLPTTKVELKNRKSCIKTTKIVKITMLFSNKKITKNSIRNLLQKLTSQILNKLQTNLTKKISQLTKLPQSLLEILSKMTLMKEEEPRSQILETSKQVSNRIKLVALITLESSKISRLIKFKVFKTPI